MIDTPKFVEWYEKFAKYYYLLDGASIDYHYLASKLDLILKKHNVKTILDFACGIGLLDIELAKKGYSVVGVDLSKSMLEEAKKNAQKAGVSINFLDGNPCNSLIGKFDLILCTYNYIGHFSEQEFNQILVNFRKNLSPNGLIFFDIFNFKFMLQKFKNELFIDVAREKNNIAAVRFNQNELDTEKKSIRINQTTFIQDAGLKLYQNHWNMKIYDINDVKAILSRQKFEPVEFFGSLYGADALCEYSEDKECIVVMAKLKNNSQE